ncbi:unnamed protein product [Symbiodinium sp. CCMP2456]|nr:unnamed protein product [Symbiodinium sp. CCMP2456]
MRSEGSLCQALQWAQKLVDGPPADSQAQVLSPTSPADEDANPGPAVSQVEVKPMPKKADQTWVEVAKEWPKSLGTTAKLQAAPTPAVSQASARPPAAKAASPAVSQASARPPAAKEESSTKEGKGDVKTEHPAASQVKTEVPEVAAASSSAQTMKREAPSAAPSASPSGVADDRVVKARMQRRELVDRLRQLDEEHGVAVFLDHHQLSSISDLNCEGHSALHLMAEEVRLGVCGLPLALQILEAAPSEIINTKTRSGRPSDATCLHMLAGSGRDHGAAKAQIVQKLVQKRADLEIRDARGSTAFLRAAGCQSLEVLQTLAESRADIHATQSTGRNAYDVANTVKNYLKTLGLTYSGAREIERADIIDNSLEARNELCQVLVIHMKLFRLPAREATLERLNVVLPTILLQGTTTADLYSGLLARLPVSLSKLAASAGETTFMLNTDSFTSCLRLNKVLATQVCCLSCPCRMHQLCLSLTSGLVYSNLMSALFCGSLTLRQSRFQQLLRTRLKTLLGKPGQVVLVYERPEDSAVSHAEAVWDLFFPLLVYGQGQSQSQTQGERRLLGRKAQAWRRLKRHLQGPLSSATVTHYCPLGCHTSREAFVEELYRDLCTLFFDAPPPVPAFNKWTKVAPVLQWFGPLLRVHQLLPQILEPVLASARTAAASRITKEFLPEDGDQEEMLEDASRDFVKQEYLRIRRFHTFVTAPNIGDKVIAVLCSMLPSLNVLGAFFKSATEPGQVLANAPEACTALDLGMPSRSPALKAMAVLIEALSDERHSLWQALLPATAAWTDELYCVASTAVLLQLGQLYSRLVQPFASWPWKAARFFENDAVVTQAEKEDLAKELLALCAHQDPFVNEYKKGLHTVQDVLSEDHLERTHYLLTTAPITNFVSEKSFAGSHTRRACNHGVSPKLPTLAAEHVLAESKSVVDTCSSVVQSGTAALSRPVATNKGRSAWHDFVRQHMSSNVTLSHVARLWHALEPPARRHSTFRLPASNGDVPTNRLSARGCSKDTPQHGGDWQEPSCAATPWPHTCDSFYPIRADALQELPQVVRNLASSWCQRIGEDLCKSKPTPAIQDQPICDTECVDKIAESVRAAREMWRKRLNRWSALFKTRPGAKNFDKPWKPLPLYHICPSDARFPGNRGLLLLEVCPLHDHQVYCRCAGANVVNGAQVQLAMESANLVPASKILRDLQKMQHECGPLQASFVNYKHQGLISIEILGLDDLAVKEKERACKEAVHKDAAQVKRTIGLLDDASLWQPKKRLRVKSAGGGRRQDNAAEGSAGPGHDEASDPVQEWDAELDARAQVGEVESHDQCFAYELFEEFGADASDIEDALDMAAECEARPSTATASASGSGAAGGAAASSSSAGRQADCQVTMDATGRVFDGSGIYLGRLTSLKPGTKDEAFSVYCARHGCQFLRKVARAPSKQALLAWFQEGTMLPAGKHPSLQHRHKQSFPSADD